MNKPDWKDIPQWANWIAQDEDGQWWAYENKPTPEEDKWNDGGERFERLRSPNWKESLEARPFDWSRVPVDTKILVSDDKLIWYKRHFAKYEKGKIHTWRDGLTSFTANGGLSSWDHAKLYKEGDADE